MLTQIINGKILTPNGWVEGGSVIISDSKIMEIANSDLPRIGARIVDVKGDYILPGLVAMNIHGAAGHAFNVVANIADNAVGNNFNVHAVFYNNV